jgi:hypothetical protein
MNTNNNKLVWSCFENERVPKQVLNMKLRTPNRWIWEQQIRKDVNMEGRKEGTEEDDKSRWRNLVAK